MAVGAAQEASIGATGGTTGLVTAEGEVFTGASSNAGGPGAATNAEVATEVSAAPQSAYPGCCSEINAMSNALNAGAELKGAVMATVRAAGSGAGRVMRACDTCRAVAEKFGVKIIEGPHP